MTPDQKPWALLKCLAGSSGAVIITKLGVISAIFPAMRYSLANLVIYGGNLKEWITRTFGHLVNPFWILVDDISQYETLRKSRGSRALWSQRK